MCNLELRMYCLYLLALFSDFNRPIGLSSASNVSTGKRTSWSATVVLITDIWLQQAYVRFWKSLVICNVLTKLTVTAAYILLGRPLLFLAIVNKLATYNHINISYITVSCVILLRVCTRSPCTENNNFLVATLTDMFFPFVEKSNFWI